MWKELVRGSSCRCGTDVVYPISKLSGPMNSKPLRRAQVIETGVIIRPLRIAELGVAGHSLHHRRQGPTLSLATCAAKMPNMKQIDWAVVDWRKSVRQIAKEQGCSRRAVYLAQAPRWDGPGKATTQATLSRQNTPSLMKNLMATR